MAIQLGGVLLVAALLISLAGCAGNPGSPAETHDWTEKERPGKQGLEKVSKRWHWMNATTGPEGELTVFDWVVPKGAAASRQLGREIILEVVPFAKEPMAASVQDWALFTIKTEGGVASLANAVLAPTYQRTGGGLVPDPPTEVLPSLEPFYFRLRVGAFDQPDVSVGTTAPYFEEGDIVTFIVAARSDIREPAPFAFRVDLQASSIYETPGTGRAEILTELETAASKNLPVRSRGTGLNLAAYSSIARGPSSVNLDPKFVGGEYRTLGLSIEETIPTFTGPIAPPVDIKVGSETALEGFSYCGGFFISLNSAGSWALDSDLHGHAFSERRLFAMPAEYGMFAWVILFGIPGFEIVRDGDGPSTATLQLTGVEMTAGLYRGYFFVHVTLGESLVDLLSVESVEGFGRIRSGLAGSSPIAVRGPHGTEILSDGVNLSLLGV